MRQVVITGPAQRDVEHNRDWWAENRSAEQAARWYRAAYAAMRSLATTAERRPWAQEKQLRQLDVRQLAFGLGRRPSHRILFGIADERVIVYRVRALKQDRLDAGNLAS